MSFLNKIVFSTERLHLRILNLKVYKELYANYEDEFICSYLGLNSIKELELEKDKFEKGLTCYDRTFEIYQMIEKKSNKVIGITGFVRWWPKHYRAEIGYALSDKSFEGKGYTSEATLPLIEYGFNKLGLNRIEAITGPEHKASQRIIEKLGMQKEGFLRNHFVLDEKTYQSIIYSILKEEWETN
jgi:ribosomal-protein-alanine N-acetyltransferase